MNRRRAYHEAYSILLKQWREWRSPEHRSYAPATVISMENSQASWVVGDIPEGELMALAWRFAAQDAERVINKCNEQQGEMKLRKGEAA